MKYHFLRSFSLLKVNNSKTDKGVVDRFVRASSRIIPPDYARSKCAFQAFHFYAVIANACRMLPLLSEKVQKYTAALVS